MKNRIIKQIKSKQNSVEINKPVESSIYINFIKYPIEFYYFLVEKNIEYHINLKNQLFIKINNEYYYVSDINIKFKHLIPNFVYKNIIPNDVELIYWNKTPHYISSITQIYFIQSYYYNDNIHHITNNFNNFEYNENPLKGNVTLIHFPLNYIHYQNILYYIPFTNNKDYLNLITNELNKFYISSIDLIQNYPKRLLIDKTNEFQNLFSILIDFKSLTTLEKGNLYKLYLQKSLNHYLHIIIETKEEVVKKEKIIENSLPIENEMSLVNNKENLKILCFCEYDKDINNNLYIKDFINYYQLFCTNIIFDNKYKFILNNEQYADNFEFLLNEMSKQEIFDLYKNKYDWIFFVKINEFLFFKKDIIIENKDNKLENKIKSFYMFKSFLKKCKKFSFVQIHTQSIIYDISDNKTKLIEYIIDYILLNKQSNKLDNKLYIYNTKFVSNIFNYSNVLNKNNVNLYQIHTNENTKQSKIIITTKPKSKNKIVSQIINEPAEK